MMGGGFPVEQYEGKDMWGVGRLGGGEIGGWGGGQAKEPASQSPRVCQNYPLANYPSSEEDKRATTHVQNGLVFLILFSFILLREGLILEKEKCENVWKRAEKCEKVPKRFCPLVVAL